MRDKIKRIEVMISGEREDYIKRMNFDELEEKYGTIPLPEKYVNRVIAMGIVWSLRNGVMFLTVLHPNESISMYTLENIHGSWGNLTLHS